MLLPLLSNIFDANGMLIREHNCSKSPKPAVIQIPRISFTPATATAIFMKQDHLSNISLPHPLTPRSTILLMSCDKLREEVGQEWIFLGVIFKDAFSNGADFSRTNRMWNFTHQNSCPITLPDLLTHFSRKHGAIIY